MDIELSSQRELMVRKKNVNTFYERLKEAFGKV
jgi:hypothetical protein